LLVHKPGRSEKLNSIRCFSLVHCLEAICL
jgi:hypothetical protein